MKLKFTPDDFVKLHADRLKLGLRFTLEDAAYRAQQIYDNYIKEHGKILYSVKGRDDFWVEKHQTGIPELKAVLIEIEEIEKKPCEHKPQQLEQLVSFITSLSSDSTVSTSATYSDPEFRCKHCGAKIRASGWESVE